MSEEWAKTVLQVSNCKRFDGENSLSAARRLCQSLASYYGLPEFTELEHKFRPHGLKQTIINQAVDVSAPDTFVKNDCRTRGISLSAASPETIDDTFFASLVNIQQDSKASENFTLSSYCLPALFGARSTIYCDGLNDVSIRHNLRAERRR